MTEMKMERNPLMEFGVKNSPQKKEYVDEFRINIEMYGDADHFGLLVISDSRKNAMNLLPNKSIPIEKATLEAIGAAFMEYLHQYCLEK